MAKARLIFAFFVGFLSLTAGHAQDRPQAPPTPKDVKPGSITLDDVPYPHPVVYLPMTMYGQDVRMAYMDVAAGWSGEWPHGRAASTG